MATNNPRLSTAIDLYIASRRAVCSRQTVENDRQILSRLLRATGDLYVRNLGSHHIEAFFASLTQEHRTSTGRTYPPVKASTYNYLYSRTSQFATWLHRRALTRADLMEHIRPLPEYRRDRLQATRNQMWAIIDAPSEPRDRAILAMACNTGLRANEIAALTVGDVCLDSLTLHTVISKSQMEDSMPITSDLELELRRWLTHYADWKMSALGRPLGPEDFLFPARLGPRYRWTCNSDGAMSREQVDPGYNPGRQATKLHRIAQSALLAVGLPTKGEGIHTIRRSVARIFFDRMVEDRGYDGAIRVVSSFLHHSNVSTTERYLGLTSERLTRDQHIRGRSLLGPRPVADARLQRGSDPSSGAI